MAYNILNLLLSSEINSLEIAYATESSAEYKNLLSFYNRCIQFNKSTPCDSIASQRDTELNDLKLRIEEDLKKFTAY